MGEIQIGKIAYAKQFKEMKANSLRKNRYKNN